jgi:hypothetical protein
MLEKKSVIDKIEITRDGHVQVRKANLIIEDGGTAFSLLYTTAS